MTSKMLQFCWNNCSVWAEVDVKEQLSALRQAAPFIVLEHLEHCSGTVLNGVYREIPEHIYVSLKHEFSCYSVFLPYIYSTSWVKTI